MITHTHLLNVIVCTNQDVWVHSLTDGKVYAKSVAVGEMAKSETGKSAVWNSARGKLVSSSE